MNKEDLCIPIYLNQKIVFDLLAIIEDGISQVSEIKEVSSQLSGKEERANAGIGVSNVLSTLLKVQLSADLQNKKENQNETQISKERVHTDVSLFSKMKSALYAAEMVHKINFETPVVENIETGDFVEIKGFLSKNPMIDTLQTFVEIFELSLKFTQEPNRSKAPKGKLSENEIIIDQVKSFLNDMTKSNSVDLLLQVSQDQMLSILLSAKVDSFVNSREIELTDGEYKIFGKVIRKINTGESVSLFRNSSLRIIENTMLNGMIGTFNEMSNPRPINGNDNSEVENTGIRLPEIFSHIDGPGFIILPIAIYS